MSASDYKAKKAIGAMLHFCLDASELSTEEILADLAAQGVDMQTVLPVAMKRIENALQGKKTWQEIALEKQQKMSLMSQQAISTVGKTKDELLAALQSLVSSGEFQVQHRDFNSLSENDLRSLLEEFEQLRKLNESKKKS